MVSQVRGGRRRDHVVEPERQHRQALRTSGIHHIDDAGGLAGPGPPGEDALARRSLQTRLQLRRRLPRQHRSANQPPAPAVQVPVRCARHRGARPVGFVQAAGPESTPGEPLDDLPAGQRALPGLFHDRQQPCDHRAGVGDEERPQSPAHLFLDLPLADRPDLDPPQPVDCRRRFADPAAEQPREPLPAGAAGQPLAFERLRRVRSRRRRAGIGELRGGAGGRQDETVVVAGRSVAGGLQRPARAVESGEAQRAGGVLESRVVDLTLHVRGHGQLRAPRREGFDPQRFGGAVQQAHALGQRPPVLVAGAGRVGGSVRIPHRWGRATCNPEWLHLCVAGGASMPPRRP